MPNRRSPSSVAGGVRRLLPTRQHRRRREDPHAGRCQLVRLGRARHHAAQPSCADHERPGPAGPDGPRVPRLAPGAGPDDNGSEFRSQVFGDTVRELGATQTFIRAGRPGTNGAVERVQRTILEECWRPSFARSLVPKLTGLARDLAGYLRFYNDERAYTGRLTRGWTPLDALIGARKVRPR